MSNDDIGAIKLTSCLQKSYNLACEGENFIDLLLEQLFPTLIPPRFSLPLNFPISKVRLYHVSELSFANVYDMSPLFHSEIPLFCIINSNQRNKNDCSKEMLTLVIHFTPPKLKTLFIHRHH